MKIIMMILAAVMSSSAFATQMSNYTETIIYCAQTAPFNSDTYYVVQVERELGRAADWLRVNEADATSATPQRFVSRQLIQDELGSKEDGVIVRTATGVGALTINYSEKKSATNYLASSFVFEKDGQIKSVILRCSHLKK